MYMCKYANMWVRFLGEIVNSRAGSEKYKVRLEQKVSESKESGVYHKDTGTILNVGFGWPDLGPFDQQNNQEV